MSKKIALALHDSHDFFITTKVLVVVVIYYKNIIQKLIMPMNIKVELRCTFTWIVGCTARGSSIGLFLVLLRLRLIYVLGIAQLRVELGYVLVWDKPVMS